MSYKGGGYVRGVSREGGICHCRWLTAALIALFVAVLLSGCGGGRTPKTSQSSLLGRSPVVRYSGPRLGSKKLPPEPVDASGVPVLLAGGAARDAYVHRLATLLDVYNEPPPTEIGFFGTVRSVSSTSILVQSQPLAVSATGGQVVQATSAVGASPGPIDVQFSKRTTNVQLLPRGIAGLSPGQEVFVGGTRSGGTVMAQLVADPARMFGHSPASQPATRTAQRSPSSPNQGTYAVGQNGEDAAASIPRPTFVSQTAAPPATTDIAPSGVNSVLMSASVGWPGIDPHFKAAVTSPGGICQLQVDAEFLLDLHTEFNWAFQFEKSGDGLTVASLDRQPSAGGAFSVVKGPVSISAATLRDFANYSVYSGYGLATGVDIGVFCQVHVAFINPSVSFGTGRLGISWAGQNESTRHVPLTGEKDLAIPPDLCPTAGGKIGPLTIGVAACETLTLHGGLLRATLQGPGGQPQGIALRYGGQDVVKQATDPSNGPLTVSKFSYAPGEATTMKAGLLFDFNLKKNKAEQEGHTGQLGQTNRKYFTAQRHEDQVGPTTPNGDWQNGTDGHWYDAESHQVAQPPAGQKAQGEANWIHPNQVKATLSNGKWLHADGRWRNADGSFAVKPTGTELAANNPGTASGDEAGEADNTDEGISPTLAQGLHGWTYQTLNTSLPLTDTSPSTLVLQLPVAAPPPPSSPVYINCLPGSLSGATFQFQPQEHPNECAIQGEPEDTAHMVVLRDAQWSNWGSSSTDATGVQLNNHPGQPGAVPSWPVRIRLDRIQSGCQAHRYYTRAVIISGISGEQGFMLNVSPACTSTPLSPTTPPPHGSTLVAAVYCDQSDQNCSVVSGPGTGNRLSAPAVGYDATRGCTWVNEGYSASLGVTKHFCWR